jgi:centromere/kinetochore protein ZW10
LVGAKLVVVVIFIPLNFLLSFLFVRNFVLELSKMDSRLSKCREIIMDSSQMDDKIATVRSQLDKAVMINRSIPCPATVPQLRQNYKIHDVIHMVQQKHVEFLPQTMFLPVQFAVEQTITKAKSSLAELQGVAEDVERQLGDIKESPRKKLDAINAILSKLQLIKELENLYEEINSDNMNKPVEVANVIKKCEEYLNSLADKDVYEPLQKVLPGMTQALSNRKCDIIRRFNNKFLEMVQYPGGKSNLQLSIARNDVEKFNTELEAMQHLGILDEQLDHFSDEILNTFVSRILDSRTPSERLIKFEVFPDNYSIVVKKNVTKADEIDPLKIFVSLRIFFGYLNQCLAGFKIDKTSFIQSFGEKLSTKLIEMIIKDCLTASVPYDDSRREAYQAVIEAANGFHALMQEYGFFKSTTLSFEAFAEKFDQIFVNRRCTKIIVAARNYIFDHSVDCVEVGSSENDHDDSAEQLIKELSLSSQIREDAFPKNTHLPKLFQFSKCKISKSIYDLGELLINTVEAAATAEQDFAAGRLLTTAHNIVKLFLMGAEKQHHETITSVPMFGALFYNACYYLCHLIMMVSLRLQPRISKQWPVLIKECNFTPYFAELRQQAAEALEQHLLQARRQISTLIGVDDVFLNLGSPTDRKECRRIVDGCIRQIQQIASVWKDVLTDAVYVRAIGSLVSYTLSAFTKMVLNKEDITETDAKEIEKEFVILLKAFEDLMKVKGQQTIQAFCESDYHKTKEIIFCLRESLLNISDRWCEGKGPLAHWLKADQVKRLIRALFQNTDRRAHVLENIN